MANRGLIDPALLTGIADAIRTQTGGSSTMTPAQMAAAIAAIDTAPDQSTVTYDITNPAVTAFVAAARAAYAGSDSVSLAADYKERGTAPQSAGLPAGGTVEAVYFDGGTGIETASGTFALKHFSPNGGRVSLRGSDGDTVWSRQIRPTGTVRFLDLSATRNARDLGGWPCDGGTVKYGMLYRMTVPNPQDAPVLLDRLGIRHQFDLRGADGAYSAAFPVPHYHVYSGGVQYTRVVTGTGDYDALLRQIVEDVIDTAAAGEPLLFHCSMGCDRTGTLAFYLEGILGLSDVDIDIEYELSSLFDDGNDSAAYYYRYRTDTRPDVDWVGLKNRVSGYPGATLSARIISYLLSIGVSAERMNAFRAAMIDGAPAILSAPTAAVQTALTHAVSDNTAQTAEYYQPYEAHITAESGYALDTATVTMGGADVTADCWSDGVISIARVTGDLVITVTAVALAPENLFDADDPDVILRARFNSSCTPVAYADGQLVTGFIPLAVGETLVLESDKAQNTNGYTGTIVCYRADGTVTSALTNQATAAGGWVWSSDRKRGYVTLPERYSNQSFSGTVKARLCVAYEEIGSISITKPSAPPHWDA